MKFQRIQDLRIDNDITIKDLSASLGLNRDVYARYEKGTRDFPIDVLIELADIYGVTIDYLVGRNDQHDPPSGDLHQKLKERISQKQRHPKAKKATNKSDK